MGARQDLHPDAFTTAGLTPREVEVFTLVVDRLRNLEIAERLHIAERTVESHVASLLRKLGGTDRMALVELGESSRERARRGNVPTVLSTFVGRDAELAQVAAFLDRRRLVTITGPAGVGKTRLAFEVTASVDGLPTPILVDLAATRNGFDDVTGAFAHSLGLVTVESDPRRSVRDALSHGRHWLVVDNCEHVSDEVASLLGDWLGFCRDLLVLATSRHPLRVHGEVVYELAPLALAPEAADLDGAIAQPATMLFADRAATASPGFVVTADNARDVVALCRRLDGLPLAIELAAARIRTFSPTELLEHLDDRFRLLAAAPSGGTTRHETLDAAVRWSYDLLDPDEQLLFERCSVFAGEFDYDTAAEVLTFDPLARGDFLRLFPRLLDRSLLSSRRLPDQSTAYRMLESFRDFGRRQLADRGTEAYLAGRHADHHLERAIGLVGDLRGPNQALATDWYRRHWIDLIAGMRWTLDRGDHARAWQLMTSVGRRWDVLGLRGEVFDWLDRLLDESWPDGTLGVHARTTAALLLCYRDTPRARQLAEEAFELARDLGERHTALSQLTLGWTLAYAGDRQLARQHLRAAAESLGSLGEPWHQALALQGLGNAAQDGAEVVEALHAAADLFGELDDPVMRGACLTMLAARSLEMGADSETIQAWLTEAQELAVRADHVHERLHVALHMARLRQRDGDHDDAALQFAELLPPLRRLGDHRCAARCLVGLGWAAATRGDDDTAVEHLKSAIAIGQQVDDPREIAAASRLLAGVEKRRGHETTAARLLADADRAAARLDPSRRAGLPGPDDI